MQTPMGRAYVALAHQAVGPLALEVHPPERRNAHRMRVSLSLPHDQPEP